MKIGNNPQKQLYENTKEIEKLISYIKEAYRTNNDVVLDTASISVTKLLTNAGEDVNSGWLLDSVGSLFKITGGDEDSLLLDFYSSLRGPKGEDGAAINIDDSITSLTKVWSSSKTSNEITGLIRDDITSNFNTWSSDQQTKLLSSGIAWTTTDKDGDNQISLSNIYIGSRTAYESLSIIKVPQLKVSDIVVYVDNDLKAKTLYRVSSISSGVATVAKVCDFSQGKEMYHNVVTINNLAWTSGDYRQLKVVLDLYLPIKFADVNAFVDWVDNLTEEVPVYGVGMGYSSGYTTIVTRIKPSGQANRMKFDIVNFNHSSLTTVENVETTNNLSSQQIIISN